MKSPLNLIHAAGRSGGAVLCVVLLSMVAACAHPDEEVGVAEVSAALAITPVNGGPLTLTPVTINASVGDQFDPHVSGDWVSYTSDDSIRYYNFSTSVDTEVPQGPLTRDLLSDVSGSKIVFSRIAGTSTAIMVFDAATAAAPVEIDPLVGSDRLGSAIGGNSVAYVDFGITPSGELVVRDLISSNSVRLTNDSESDQNPSISPDGNVITWEHCISLDRQLRHLGGGEDRSSVERERACGLVERRSKPRHQRNARGS